MKIEWNTRLNKTAGLTYSGFFGGQRTSRIELATKVVTDLSRLRQTLAHELCHAASWVISGTRKPPHGTVFKTWASRVQDFYPELKVTRCHSYEIEYKYRWICTNPDCSWEIRRHSKSVDVEKHVCGRCRSRIVDCRANTPQKVSAYHAFQRREFLRLKTEGSTLSFGEKSKIVAELWARRKDGAAVSSQ